MSDLPIRFWQTFGLNLPLLSRLSGYNCSEEVSRGVVSMFYRLWGQYILIGLSHKGDMHNAFPSIHSASVG